MGAMVGVGLGILIGALVGFPAGQRYVLFKQQRELASEHWGLARGHLSGAIGPLGLLLLVIAGGLVLMFFGS